MPAFLTVASGTAPFYLTPLLKLTGAIARPLAARIMGELDGLTDERPGIGMAKAAADELERDLLRDDFARRDGAEGDNALRAAVDLVAVRRHEVG